MKFKDFLILEDDGGFDAGPAASSTSNIDTTPAPLGMFTRLSMPQISKDMFSLFKADLNLHGISYKEKAKKVKLLKPTQGEFNNDKVNSIKTSIADGSYKHSPILVSNDGYIIDGHHRWKAFDQHNSIGVFEVGTDYNSLFEFLKNKPYAVNRDVNQ